MIEIIQKEERRSSWCIACINQCGQQDDHICNTCLGFMATIHTCPVCNVVGRFFGHDKPDYCQCGYIWPDLIDIKHNVQTRVNYHLKESL